MPRDTQIIEFVARALEPVAFATFDRGGSYADDRPELEWRAQSEFDKARKRVNRARVRARIACRAIAEYLAGPP